MLFGGAWGTNIALSNASSKEADLVGKMWCIILYWKAINFESLVIRKGNVYTLWMLSLEKPEFRILFSDVGGLTLLVRSVE